MTYLRLLFILVYIVWTICSLVVIVNKPKELFKTNYYMENITPLTNIWIVVHGIALAVVILYNLDKKVFWEE